jgi:hypothetical protein
MKIGRKSSLTICVAGSFPGFWSWTGTYTTAMQSRAFLKMTQSKSTDQSNAACFYVCCILLCMLLLSFNDTRLCYSAVCFLTSLWQQIDQWCLILQCPSRLSLHRSDNGSFYLYDLLMFYFAVSCVYRYIDLTTDLSIRTEGKVTTNRQVDRTLTDGPSMSPGMT